MLGVDVHVMLPSGSALLMRAAPRFAARGHIRRVAALAQPALPQSRPRRASSSHPAQGLPALGALSYVGTLGERTASIHARGEG